MENLETLRQQSQALSDRQREIQRLRAALNVGEETIQFQRAEVYQKIGEILINGDCPY